MRIGILTFHYADNYGAVLQAYALQTYLRNLGHDVEIINYQPRNLVNGNLSLSFSLRAIISNLYVLYIRWVKFIKFLTDNQKKSTFDEFRKRFLRISPESFSSYQEIRNVPLKYDVYICGSDQIWNPPVHVGVDPVYYLDFAPSGCKRLAYAASFGRNSIEPKYNSKIASLLRNIDTISIREKSGIQIVSSLIGKKVFWLPDPTLLLEDYQVITQKQNEVNYVFSYALREGKWVKKVNKAVSKVLCLKKIGLKGKGSGPAEWLGYISGAEFVVTNSLHGVIFSILFRRPFIAVSLTGRNAVLNDRIISLLERLHLEERFMKDYNGVEVKRLINRPINWEYSRKMLQEWRNEAYKYLINELV